MARPSTALIVDDEEHARAYARLLLKELGVTTCWEAGDGLQAVALYEQHRPELVLLDVNLRMMTGLQVLQHMMHRRPEVPVIVLSSENAMKTVNEALRLGATDYVLKHMPKDAALKAISETLDAVEAGDEDDGGTAAGR
jgi:CheY-like chemotaxis protein